jgi:hypothetical protein
VFPVKHPHGVSALAHNLISGSYRPLSKKEDEAEGQEACGCDEEYQEASV